MTDITKHEGWCLSLDDDGHMPCDCGTRDAELRAEGAKREQDRIARDVEPLKGDMAYTDMHEGWDACVARILTIIQGERA